MVDFQVGEGPDDASKKRFSWFDSQGAKERRSDRSRQELSNEYLVAKFGFDTTVNEPSKVCEKGYLDS